MHCKRGSCATILLLTAGVWGMRPLRVGKPDQRDRSLQLRRQAERPRTCGIERCVANVITLPVLVAAPSLFTLAASGTGPGAILNFDVASSCIASTPQAMPPPRHDDRAVRDWNGAPPIQACSDGVIVPLVGHPFRGPRSCHGSDRRPAGDGPVCGRSAWARHGLTQINALVPADAPAGASVSVVVKTGTAASQPGVTLSVR